ncbi:MAG: DnaJ domain-containing protein [Micavibrio sp.]
MPYVILVIGFAIGVFGLYRFLLKADARQVKTLFLSLAAAGVGLGSLVLAVTGRLPAALAILMALWPIAVSYLRNRKLTADPDLPVSAKEAYDILGLESGASPEEIKEAHLRLIRKVHPDQEGSDWLAQKINAARDILLGGKER